MTLQAPLSVQNAVEVTRRPRPSASLIVATCFAILLALFGNSAMLAAGAVILVAQLALSVLQLMPAFAPKQSLSRKAAAGAERVFSVHVATHDEPPAVVIRTIEALLAQTGAPRYEIIVLDNNTQDPALWKPVAEFCRGRLDVIFSHRTGVIGAKAGALAIARTLSRGDATHVITVDADYVAAPDFLARAARMLDESGADFIQFPQAYSGASVAPGVAGELADYFRRFAHHGSLHGEALLTGTLSVISIDALDAVGGWRADTVTEDAELGTRLVRGGFRGHFAPQIAGWGMLPLSADSLCTQRRRWAHGNAATLLLHMNGLRSVVALRQLSAWLNLQAPGAALLLWGLAAQVTGAPHGGAITVLGMLVVILPVLSTTLPLVVAERRATLCRLALIPSSALATFEALLGLRLAFARTPKVTGFTEWRIPSELLVSLAAACLVAGLVGLGAEPMAILAAAALGLPTLAYFFLAHELEGYSRHIERVLP